MVKNVLFNKLNVFFFLCSLVYVFLQRVYGLNCGSHYFFICQDNQNGQTDYIFIPEAKNWSEAQHYCSQNHEELANIPTVGLSTTVQKQDFPIWIGLHKDGKCSICLSVRPSAHHTLWSQKLEQKTNTRKHHFNVLFNAKVCEFSVSVLQVDHGTGMQARQNTIDGH